MFRRLLELSSKFRISLPYIGKTLRLIWPSGRKWTLGWMALLVVQGILPAITVHLMRIMVDRLASAIQAPGDSRLIRTVLFFVLLLCAVQILTELLRMISNWIRNMLSESVHDYVMSLIHEKATSIDLAFYENPDYFDHLHRAREDATYRPVALLENIGVFFQSGITLVAMAIVLIRFGWWVPVVLILCTIPALLVAIHYTIRHYEWVRRNTPNERKTWYYDWLLTSPITAAEIRLFHISDFFRSAFQEVRGILRNQRSELMRAQTFAAAGAVLAGFAGTAATMLWIVWKTAVGMVSLGELVLFYQAFTRGQQLMHSLLENVGQLYTNSLFLRNFFEFLSLQPFVVDGDSTQSLPVPICKGIQLSDVSFQYPGSNRTSLRNFNLTVPAGQVTAIVGPNGAGKSTVLKLICRLYDPLKGMIEIDGIDLRHFKITDLRRMISVLFQEPVRYNSTVRENIATGDLSRMKENHEIEQAARLAGAEEIVLSLPKQYDSLLGKRFEGGTELSAGEWQRIALSRAFFRKSSLILLDEPTSAMDAWAEADWMDRFRILAEGRTALIITHRFTTAMRADMIHVMEDGQIVESGSHAELISKAGKYAQSWYLQMQQA